jgi:hypothetical protein
MKRTRLFFSWLCSCSGKAVNAKWESSHWNRFCSGTCCVKREVTVAACCMCSTSDSGDLGSLCYEAPRRRSWGEHGPEGTVRWSLQTRGASKLFLQRRSTVFTYMCRNAKLWLVVQAQVMEKVRKWQGTIGYVGVDAIHSSLAVSLCIISCSCTATACYLGSGTCAFISSDSAPCTDRCKSALKFG